MSDFIVQVVKKFVEGDVGADEFTDFYQSLWAAERDRGNLQKLPPTTDEALSTIFCLADVYNPDDDREDYELDENQLRTKVRETLEQFKLL